MIPTDDRPDQHQAGPPGFESLLRASTHAALRQVRGGDAGRVVRALLAQTAAALAGGAVDQSLRLIDRAWRLGADHAQVLAPIYGRMLALEGHDPEAALRLLERVAAPDGDVAALIAHLLLRVQRQDEARQAINAALADFCVTAGGLLAAVASQVLHAVGTPVPGWIGRGPRLEFFGCLADGVSAHALQIGLTTGARFIQPIHAAAQAGAGPQYFQFQLPQVGSGDRLSVACHDVPLLGSGCRIPPDFGLDGRASSTARIVHGWARLPWLPTQPLRLRIEDEHGARHHGITHAQVRAGDRWPFHIDLNAAGLRGRRLDVSAQVPDGTYRRLPDMPLLLDSAVRLRSRVKPLPSRWTPASPTAVRPATPRRRLIDIIIPVYRGHRETLTCIDSALTTGGNARVLVVDDATDDAELAAALDELRRAGRITLLRNASNLGFVGSVNRAMARSRTRDVVLLNADAVVFGDWLPRLRATAYGHSRIGTVTPFSNNGSIASYPRLSEEPLNLEQAAHLHRLAADTLAGVHVDIPVGVGFCLYVRRDCLDDVGEFDAAVFGAGYGEESDFCLRARQRGWSHRLAADVFVYHAGGRSFGTRRAALLDRGRRLINVRHPGYDRFIRGFLAADPLSPLRRRLDEERLAALRGGRFVLLVTLALEGGVARFVAERCRALRALGLFPLLLRPRAAGDSRHCELSTAALDVPNLHYRVPKDLPALTRLLRRLPLATVELHHFLHLDPRVIDLVRSLDVPYDVTVHDYAWLCGRVTLIDGSRRYCGEPDVSVCNVCVEKHGDNLGEHLSVSALRARSALWLHHARRVAAPSVDAATRLKRYFDIDVHVRPHASLPEAGTEPARPPVRRLRAGDQVVRVALIGAIGEHKGYQVLLRCARDAQRRRLPLEFVVIGYTEDDAPLLAVGNVFITGKYREGEAAHLLRREHPDVAFMASVVPETWCYALDDALAAGLPVAAFDLGAIAERLRGVRVGMLMPLDISARQINERLLALASQTPLAPQRDMAIMRKSQEQNMDNAAVGSMTQQDGLSASVQLLPLSAGLYLFSVKSTPLAVSRAAGQLQLPALHVGLGPGMRSQQVEFIGGPVTDGAWLFAKEDCLVTKVHGAGATLVLTSVRGPGGESLSIAVERLDNRAESAPVAAAGLVVPAAEPDPSAHVAVFETDVLRVQIGAHIRTRGDMSFSETAWAGRIATGLWIESFSVRPLQIFESRDIEYKGLTGSGFETPWVSDGGMCGTKGMAVPLVGFAIRLKPSKEAAAFDCEYSGYFKSGVTVGPMRNGAPCRSTVANDPLEGIQISIRKRPGAVSASGKPAGTDKPARLEPAAPASGPSFGRYRDGNGHEAREVAEAHATRNDSEDKATAKTGTHADDKSQRNTAAAKRTPVRRT